MGDPLIDEGLTRVAGAKRGRSPQAWVEQFVGVKDMKHRLAEQLCRRGVLQADEDRILHLFTRRIYPEINPVPEREIIGRLENAIFTDTLDIDPRTVVLVSLAHHASLLPMVFDKKHLKGRKARIEQVVRGDVTGDATREAMEAMEAAIMVAVMVPMMVTSVGS